MKVVVIKLELYYPLNYPEGKINSLFTLWKKQKEEKKIVPQGTASALGIE